MAKHRINVGIIGCGAAATLHVKGYLNSQMANIVALSDRRIDRAKSLAEKFGLSNVKIFEDYEDLLKCGEIEAVSICTPHYLHAEMTLKAAEYKKHVLCEKPISTSLKQADEMINACKKSGVKLGVSYQFRFTPDIQKTKKEFDEGEFGIPIYGEAFVKWYRSDEAYYHADDVAKSWRGMQATEGGGALITQAIHFIDLLQWIMGPVEYLHGIYATRSHRIEVEDIGVACLKFKSGALGLVLGSVSLRPEENWLAIYGSKKSVVIGSDNRITRKWEENPKTVYEEEESPPYGHDGIIKDFLRAIVEDRDPAIPGEEARKSLEIVIAIYRAHQTGRRIYLPLSE